MKAGRITGTQSHSGEEALVTGLTEKSASFTWSKRVLLEDQQRVVSESRVPRPELLDSP